MNFRTKKLKLNFKTTFFAGYSACSRCLAVDEIFIRNPMMILQPMKFLKKEVLKHGMKTKNPL